MTAKRRVGMRGGKARWKEENQDRADRSVEPHAGCSKLYLPTAISDQTVYM